MPRRGKKYNDIKEKVEPGPYTLEDAIKLSQELSYAKFDETVEMAIRLGVNPKHADQMVRGSVVMPRGTGKEVKVLAFAQGEKAMEAEEAGADYVGTDEYIKKIQDGWLEFDRAVATPDVMSMVGRLGRVLGPRGLMPNPKSGTVSFDIGRVIRDVKSGSVEFRVDRSGNVHAPIGKVSFDTPYLVENAWALLETLMKLKPATSKGQYLRNISVSSTMGPGIEVDSLKVASALR
jgi:large subunit ribosomal protein L1